MNLVPQQILRQQGQCTKGETLSTRSDHVPQSQCTVSQLFSEANPTTARTMYPNMNVWTMYHKPYVLEINFFPKQILRPQRQFTIEAAVTQILR